MLFEAIRDPNPEPSQITELDANEDGILSAEDIDAYLTSLEILRGDLDLNNDVDFADFLVLSSNFGEQGGWSDGDVTGDGDIDFADFLWLSGNFTSNV